jgi:hypothetical protein
MNSFIDSMVRWNTRHGTDEHRENGAGRLALLEYLLFGLQPVFEGMTVRAAMLFIQGVGSFRDTRTEVLGTSINLISTGLLVAP